MCQNRVNPVKQLQAHVGRLHSQWLGLLWCCGWRCWLIWVHVMPGATRVALHGCVMGAASQGAGSEGPHPANSPYTATTQLMTSMLADV
jgi:hypothetical protein